MRVQGDTGPRFNVLPQVANEMQERLTRTHAACVVGVVRRRRVGRKHEPFDAAVRRCGRHRREPRAQGVHIRSARSATIDSSRKLDTLGKLVGAKTGGRARGSALGSVGWGSGVWMAAAALTDNSRARGPWRWMDARSGLAREDADLVFNSHHKRQRGCVNDEFIPQSHMSTAEILFSCNMAVLCWRASSLSSQASTWMDEANDPVRLVVMQRGPDGFGVACNRDNIITVLKGRAASDGVLQLG